jgi:hypothetical protein
VDKGTSGEGGKRGVRQRKQQTSSEEKLTHGLRSGRRCVSSKIDDYDVTVNRFYVVYTQSSNI